MKNYEIMFIVRPDLEEANIKAVAENMKSIIESNGAKITEFKEMGQRELAYEIKKHATGYYFLINIESADSKAIEEFDRLALISEDIIRHLIVKIEA